MIRKIEVYLSESQAMWASISQRTKEFISMIFNLREKIGLKS
jgi:hypothetical protein